MSDFRSDLKSTSFVKSPADAVVNLYEQYVHDLGNALDRHAPLISRLTKKDSEDWMSDEYRHAKSLRRQFQIARSRAKNPLNRSQLHRQQCTYNKHSDACIYLPPYELDVLKITYFNKVL